MFVATTFHVDAFVPPVARSGHVMTTLTTPTMMSTPTATKLGMIQDTSSMSTMTMAATTVDPTSFLTDILGGVLGTPLILAIPIVAALGVASLVVFLIVSYANPAEPDD